MKKKIVIVLFVLYFLVSIIVTNELLSYNDYNIIEYKKNYITTPSEDSLYKKSDLLIIKKNKEININDNIIYYELYGSKVNIKVSSIKKIENNNYVLENNKIITKDEILGNQKNTKSIHYFGKIHNLLLSTSRVSKRLLAS